MTIVAETSVVTIDLQLFAQDGRLVQNLKDYAFIQGVNDILPGMAPHLLGKQIGEPIVGELSPEDAFGIIEDFEPIRYDKNDLGPNFYQLYIGMGIPFDDEDGNPLVLYVQELSSTFVSLTINHPLAGQLIGFEATVTDIRQATEAEVIQGFPGTPVSSSCSCC